MISTNNSDADRPHRKEMFSYYEVVFTNFIDKATLSIRANKIVYHYQRPLPSHPSLREIRTVLRESAVVHNPS